MKIYIGADHRGFELKEKVKTWLIDIGYDVTDCGNIIYDKDDDYPDFAFAVADKVSQETDSRGIVICGSAGGVTFCANRVKKIRCAASLHIDEVKHNRNHNNMNVLALSADFTDLSVSKELVMVFLNTDFDPQERFLRRLKKIEDWEKAE
jgi:ribose 5-phosphate isomerase B